MDNAKRFRQFPGIRINEVLQYLFSTILWMELMLIVEFTFTQVFPLLGYIKLYSQLSGSNPLRAGLRQHREAVVRHGEAAVRAETASAGAHQLSLRAGSGGGSAACLQAGRF